VTALVDWVGVLQSDPWSAEALRMLEHSDDALLDHAYLVARGVRPLALIGTCANDQAEAVGARLSLLAEEGIVPYVIPAARPGRLACGYGAAPWTVALLRWTLSEECPEAQRDRILGLLLGYSPEAIESFEGTTSSPSPGSSSRPSARLDNQGIHDPTA
jgi:hypothetical protein